MQFTLNCAPLKRKILIIGINNRGRKLDRDCKRSNTSQLDFASGVAFAGTFVALNATTELPEGKFNGIP